MHTYNVIGYAKQELLKNWTWAFVWSDEISPVLAGCNSGGAAHGGGGGGCGEADGEKMMTMSGFSTSFGDQDSSFHKRRSGIEAKAVDLTFLQYPEKEEKKRWS